MCPHRLSEESNVIVPLGGGGEGGEVTERGECWHGSSSAATSPSPPPAPAALLQPSRPTLGSRGCCSRAAAAPSQRAPAHRTTPHRKTVHCTGTLRATVCAPSAPPTAATPPHTKPHCPAHTCATPFCGGDDSYAQVRIASANPSAFTLVVREPVRQQKGRSRSASVAYTSSVRFHFLQTPSGILPSRRVRRASAGGFFSTLVLQSATPVRAHAQGGWAFHIPGGAC